MGWKGALIGSFLGGFRGGWLGSLGGAYVGHFIEERFFRKRRFARMASRDPLAAAYDVLGVSPKADDETVRAAYRAMARKYHPDTLRAQGLSEKLIGQTTARMSRINAAWTQIKAARGI